MHRGMQSAASSRRLARGAVIVATGCSALAVGAVLLGVGPRRAGSVQASAGSAAADSQPKRLAVVQGLKMPEAVSYDPRTHFYFVSNANGAFGVKNDSGFITRITSDGKLDSLHFIRGGRNDVVLNAPMGSRIRGDTLWVLDVDALRAFDTRSGKAFATINVPQAQGHFLNDLTFAPDGSIYITDTGVSVAPDGKSTHTGPDRIFRISRGHQVTVALATPSLAMPDGIAWDANGRRFVLAPFGGMSIQSWRAGQPVPAEVTSGKGRFDGIEIERNGRILITSWNDSSVSTLDDNRLVRRIGPLEIVPADVSMDEQHGRVGIVSVVANEFELWTWPWR
jgi:sugar lactone lactonase YvrE